MSAAEPQWQPYREPLRATLLRTVPIALVLGTGVAVLHRQPSAWLVWTAFAFWFTFGGHWVELFFLNTLRPRVGSGRWLQVPARVFTWFAGGTLLLLGATITVRLLAGRPLLLPLWWAGGVGFIGLELLVHMLLQLRGRPNFYNGLG